MSQSCQCRHGVRVLSCDLQHKKRNCNDWKMLVIADRKIPIPDTAAFRVDFERWLRTLTRRDRKAIRAFIRGDGTGGVVAQIGVSPSRVSQLRRVYERLWEWFQGELEPAVRTA